MASAILRRSEIWKLPLRCVRWRTNIDVKRPKPPHFRRAKLLAAAAPVYEPDTTPPELKCSFVRYKKPTLREPIQFEKIVTRIILELFEKHEFIAIYHANQFFQDEFMDTKRLFFKSGLTFFIHDSELLTYALQNTKFKPLINFFNCLPNEVLVFCKEKSDVRKVLNLQKKAPNLVLIGGVLEDRLMSKNDLIKYSNLPDLPIARAQLCNTLTGIAQQTVAHLSYHQQHLSQMLTQHIDQVNKKE